MPKKRTRSACRGSNPKVELEIASVAYGGKGVGRGADGKIVFVPDALPGEKVLVELIGDRGDYFDGALLDVLESSSHRIDSDCIVHSGFDNTGVEYFVPVPGCVYRNFSYEEEIRVKNLQFTEFIGRAASAALDGDSAEIAFKAPTPSPNYLNYRNKTTFHVSIDGSEVLLGYRMEGSHAVVDIPECPLSHPQINEAIRDFRGTTGYRSTLRDGMTLTFRRTENDGVVFWRNNPPKNASWLRESTVLGNISVPMSGFFQVNPRVSDLLVEKVVKAIADFAPASVLDLYCGCGLFSMAAAKAGVERVSGLDADSATIAAAEYNAEKAEIPDWKFTAKPAEKGFKDFLLDHETRGGGSLTDAVLIIDPPRAGLARSVKAIIAASDLRHLVYVSCSPSTLSRDIRELLRAGFSIKSAEMLDMFPRTAHFESLIVLERSFVAK